MPLGWNPITSIKVVSTTMAIDAYRREYLQNPEAQEAQYTLFLRGNAFAALSNHAKAIVDYDDSIERDRRLASTCEIHGLLQSSASL